MNLRECPIESSRLPTFKFGCYGVCTYCGDPADSIDHVIPISYQTAMEHRRFREGFGPLTYACRECNSKLSNRYFSEFRMRCEFVRDWLNARAQPIYWTNWQMARLDYTIRTLAKASTEKAKWLRTRADWFESREFLLNIDHLAWEPAIDRNSKMHHPWMRRYFDSTLQMLRALDWKHSDD